MRNSSWVGLWLAGVIGWSGCARTHGPDDDAAAGGRSGARLGSTTTAGTTPSIPGVLPTPNRPAAVGGSGPSAAGGVAGRMATPVMPAAEPSRPRPATPVAVGGMNGSAGVAGHGANPMTAGTTSTPTEPEPATAGRTPPPPPPPSAGNFAPAAGVNCGQVFCMNAQAPGIIFPPACCADPATSTCGTSSGGNCLAIPLYAPNCPSLSISGVTLRGCCVLTTNRCGVDASVIGMGCVSFETAPGVEIEGRPETACDGTLVSP